MVLKLYGSPLSTCTKRVAVVLREKQVPYEFFPIDLAKGEHKTPEFLAKQPFGQVPYIEDDGLTLFESRAICRYIQHKYPDQGTQLIPADLKKRALFEQAASSETANFDAFAATAVFEALFKKYRGLETDQARLKDLLTSLEAKLDTYDKILAKQKYVAGNEITLADLFHLPYGVLLPAAGSNAIAERPNVSRWFNDIQNRPSWQAVKDGLQTGLWTPSA